MAKRNIPAWSFPTTVIFIDDNIGFLKKMLLALSGKNMTLKLINDPHKAIQFLQKQPHRGSIAEQFTEAEVENQQAAVGSVDDVLNALDKKIYDANRFGEIGVVVVDYAMPGLNGLEICSKLRSQNSRFKILMLTGEASTQLAVEAFNDGKIDKFMRKDEPDFQSKLFHAIRTLQDSYFQDISESILNRLDIDRDNPIAPNLYEPEFSHLFDEICQKNNIVEHYLIDSDGSFLLVNAKGIPSLLTIKNEQSMSDIYDVALNASEPFSSSALQAMAKNQKILCLYGVNIFDDSDQAEKFLQPAQKLVGEKNYYYALVKDLAEYNIDLSKIRGFKTYLEKENSASGFFIDKI